MTAAASPGLLPEQRQAPRLLLLADEPALPG
jgi:hypothetical protein